MFETICYMVLLWSIACVWIFCGQNTVCATCKEELGMKSKTIPDQSITSSSKLSMGHAAAFARLDGRKAWCPAPEDKSPYLEIQLGDEKTISAVTTQGSFQDFSWARKYEISYMDHGKWRLYERELAGNRNSRSRHKNTLHPVIKTDLIRIYPKDPFGVMINPVVPCIRLELYGCSTSDQAVFKDCADIYKAGKRVSGVYTIDPDGSGAFNVYCDQTTAGGGWTVFQKRLDGSIDFYRGWDDYKRGFGNLSGEFWLGLDKIHRLTREETILRVDFKDFNENTAYAEYSSFGVGDEARNYELSLGSYSGTAGDSLSYHRGMAFATRDKGISGYSTYCATQFKGAWWYRGCHKSNLNGLYLKGAHSTYADGVNWYHWRGYYYSIKRAEMKVKPFNN